MKIFLSFIFLASLISFGFYAFYSREINLPISPSSSFEIIFSIKEGQGSKEISENLKKQGLIKYSSIFRIYVLLEQISGKLQAGDYSLSQSLNIKQLAEKFSRGLVIKNQLTIIEGWNLRDIGFYLEGKGISQAEEFFELAGFPAVDYSKASGLPPPKDFFSEYAFLKDKPKNLGLEGYLFPDTYQFSDKDGLEGIVRKMLANFDRKLNPQFRQEIERQNRTIFEIVTMASLLEKEVKTLQDKKLVSGILWKRLEVNMPLQVDATISYITAKKTTRVSIEETKIDSPYNTYRYKSLPLGPIANPGAESIEAALHPEKSEYWYYLSSRDGRTIFSRTFQEHNLAKEKYLASP